MKKAIVSLFLLIPLLSGCTNIDTQVTLNDDKTASVASSLTYNGNLADPSDTTALTIVNNYDKFLDPLYQTENAYDDRLSTITAVKNVKNLKVEDLDLSSLGFKSNLKSGKFIELRKNFLVTSYNIDLTYDLKKQIKRIKKAQSKIIEKSKGLVPEYYQKYGDLSELEPSSEKREDFMSNLDEDTKVFTEKNLEEKTKKNPRPESLDDLTVSFSIKTPSFASFNNADSFNGTVYSWKIDNENPTVIKLQYVRYSGFAIAFVLVLLVSLIILLAHKIVKHDSQKRADTENNIV